MPTFKQAHFLPRAVESLLAQRLQDWELIVVDDGSPDETRAAVQPFLADPRVSYHRLPHNAGLGAALNHASALARGTYLAYLPSDDLYFPQHLERLCSVLAADPGVTLAYGGLRWGYRFSGPTLRGEEAVGNEAQALDWPLASGQSVKCLNLLTLVQVMHRREGVPRWTERTEKVSDRLEADFWRAMLEGGARFAFGGGVTCEWVEHPEGQHNLIAGVPGGLSRYRAHHGIPSGEYLNFQPSRGMRVNERERYGRFAEQPLTPGPDSLKILLVGSLGFNPERLLAFEERGHRLYGLWSPEPETWDHTGPFSFGHVTDLPHEGWRAAVEEIKPDVIYALLNWQALPLIREVLDARTGIPLVFHFKEGPFICHEHGLWSTLTRVLRESDGQIYISPENREWFRLALGGETDLSRTLILDGDLPKLDWFTGDWSPKLSAGDGEIHTVCAGRPLGLEPLSELGQQGIHVHFYGTHFHEWFPNWTRTGLESGYLHLHPTVEPGDWVRELSRYDAAWVQQFASDNGGDLRRASWDDLNLPARLGTYAAAGLPWIMRENPGSCVAMAELARAHGFGVFYRNFGDLGQQLRDRARLERQTANARAARHHFAFDTHVDELIAFFRRVGAGPGA